ncbi:SMP-30/gluconolactonase/LRE family protein [Conexibacter woesei]|uniref:SMP-30/Gluconolaconase/LRE domain protein n=1 Tax=Conexibacter woesei (strain DSM 14684 / CCUG 47730 / CIP 108061 / JCM 11494 / NBRC 100937 / ID131577) TaxID=469383 RepID=D3F381_CONWI|nr:SMP-30/gluconolactonase/LRE family protein [Conexibacter woesei]ADB50361.1 SMP-30/Gluconolaconase/LRE domain protein [Conexibacter woesei DSM 14684]
MDSLDSTTPANAPRERDVRVLADGMAFPENPRWHDGRLYLCDHLLGRVHVLEDDGLRLLAEVPGQPSGMGWTPAGEHLVVSMNDRRLLRLAGGELHAWAQLGELVPGPLNDMVVGPGGRAYVGNFGSDLVGGEPFAPTVLVRVDPDGTAVVAAEDLSFPNGTVITPDGRTLIVAETYALRLTAFDVDSDGGLSNRRAWATFGDPIPLPERPERVYEHVLSAGATVPDGIALDAEGAVWVADPVGDAVLRVAEGGAILDRVPTGELGSYAVALGGANRRTLYVCANARLGTLKPGEDRLGRLLACAVEVPGAGWA